MRPELVLTAGVTVWGLGWIAFHSFARQGLAGMPLVLAVYIPLALIAVPVLFAQRRRWLSQWRSLLAIGLFGGASSTGLVMALSLGDVVRVMLLFYLAPVWSMLGGRLLLGERITPLRMAALFLALAGVALTLGVDANTLATFSWIDGTALLAGFLFSMGNLATRGADRIPMASKVWSTYIGAAATAIVGCMVINVEAPRIGPTLGLELIAFSVVWMACMWAAQYGFSHVETHRASILALLELVISVISAALLGERAVSLHEWLGSGLILAAALLSSGAFRKTPASPSGRDPESARVRRASLRRC